MTGDIISIVLLWTFYLYLETFDLRLVITPHSWLVTGFVTRLTLVEQELLTLLEHLSSPPVFIRVLVTRSLVLYVCFVDLCLYFYTFSFGHCIVCSSSIYGFWLPLWYLQTLLNGVAIQNNTVCCWRMSCNRLIIPITFIQNNFV